MNNGLIVLYILTIAYFLHELNKRDKRIDDLLDRMMSRSVFEYKRVAEKRKPAPSRPAPNDDEMARWEAKMVEGRDGLNQEIDEKLAKLMSSTGKAGVL